jgi:hypothetical protein
VECFLYVCALRSLKCAGTRVISPLRKADRVRPGECNTSSALKKMTTAALSSTSHVPLQNFTSSICARSFTPHSHNASGHTKHTHSPSPCIVPQLLALTKLSLSLYENSDPQFLRVQHPPKTPWHSGRLTRLEQNPSFSSGGERGTTETTFSADREPTGVQRVVRLDSSMASIWNCWKASHTVVIVFLVVGAGV